MTSLLYHDGNRALQDEFGSTALAERMEERIVRTAFTPDDQAFIEAAIYFFLATADAKAGPTARSRAGPLASSASPGRRNWRFPTTMATACTRASATST
jgi:hypothetical protein